MKRKISIIEDFDGTKIVIINDIIFKGKRHINWKDVENYLKKYINDIYIITETGEQIYIGNDLPSEYSGSIYTRKLKGTNAKAKANASQGIPEMIEIANKSKFSINYKFKHQHKAKYGWYKYDTRFALPIIDDNGKIINFNIFKASLLIRHAENGRKYLYDILDIKKETSNCFHG